VSRQLGDPDADAASDRRAQADIREGRLVGHQAVTRRLKSWGSGKRLPKPNPGD
jgi:hypothetical protein